jgi:hypothetical protein
MDDVTVRRVDFGYFVRPPEETGTGSYLLVGIAQPQASGHRRPQTCPLGGGIGRDIFAWPACYVPAPCPIAGSQRD